MRGANLAALIGKLGLYVIVYWVWCIAWTAYLTGWRGWGVRGDLVLLLAAQFAFYCATAAIAAFLPAITRNVDLALSASALYAGSGLSFANATLPVSGAPLFTRIWSAVLPSTSYIQIQEQQLLLGSSIVRAAPLFGILLLFILVPLFFAVRRLKQLALQPRGEEALSVPPSHDSVIASYLQTLRVVLTTRPIMSTIVLSIILYGFYYPMAYKVQTVVKLPVAVVDLDHSPISRGFLRKLNATREVHIAYETASIQDALISAQGRPGRQRHRRLKRT